MNHEATLSSMAVVSLAYLILAAPDPASADDRRSSICERTADRMFNACLFELGDDLHTTLANCANIGD